VDEIGIDGAVLVVTLATSVVTSLLFGVIPVLRSRVLSVEVLRATIDVDHNCSELCRMTI
jgi:hypothetical protein